MPESLEEELGLRQLATRRHHQDLWAALGEITRDLEHMEVDLATIKGVTAEARWYESLGQRPSIDLDLLIHPSGLDDVEKAVDLMHPDHHLRAHLREVISGTRLQSMGPSGPDDIWVDLHFDALKLGLATR